MKPLLLFGLLLGVANANAQSFFENFNYTTTGSATTDTLTNPSLGGAIWKRHSGVANPIKWVNAGLLYAGYTGSGVAGAVLFGQQTTSAEDANVEIGPFKQDSTMFPNLDSSLYASFILNVSASGGTTGDYFVHLGQTSGTVVSNFLNRVFLKDGGAANSFKIGLSKGSAASGAVFTTSDYPLNTPVLIVLRHKFKAGAVNDTAMIYVFSGGNLPATRPSSPTLTATDMTIADPVRIFSFCIRQGSVGNGAASMDAIRVALSWEDAVTLPVKFSSFSAIGLQNQVNLNWLTASEINTQRFDIERSVDAINFTTVASVNAKGTSTHGSNYQMIDKILPSSTILYYRIKSISNSGSFEYSSIQKVSLRSVHISISPNPASNQLLLNATSFIETAELIDMMGKRVYFLQNNKTNSARIDVSNLPTGTYTLKTVVDGVASVQQVAVSH